MLKALPAAFAAAFILPLKMLSAARHTSIARTGRHARGMSHAISKIS
jgi:hypothetical protein